MFPPSLCCGGSSHATLTTHTNYCNLIRRYRSHCQPNTAGSSRINLLMRCVVCFHLVTFHVPAGSVCTDQTELSCRPRSLGFIRDLHRDGHLWAPVNKLVNWSCYWFSTCSRHRLQPSSPPRHWMVSFLLISSYRDYINPDLHQAASCSEESSYCIHVQLGCAGSSQGQTFLSTC